MRDLRAALGSRLPLGTSQLVLFVPSLDRDRQPIDQDGWVDEALSLFGNLFRGATAFPPGQGVWRDDERDGRLLHETTVMVTSYADPSLLDDPSVLEELRAFLHRFGRDGAQGEVGIIIEGAYHGLEAFDDEGGER